MASAIWPGKDVRVIIYTKMDLKDKLNWPGKRTANYVRNLMIHGQRVYFRDPQQNTILSKVNLKIWPEKKDENPPADPIIDFKSCYLASRSLENLALKPKDTRIVISKKTISKSRFDGAEAYIISLEVVEVGR